MATLGGQRENGLRSVEQRQFGRGGPMTALPRTAAILASVGPRDQQPLRGSQRERSRAHSLSPIAASPSAGHALRIGGLPGRNRQNMMKPLPLVTPASLADAICRQELSQPKSHPAKQCYSLRADGRRALSAVDK